MNESCRPGSGKEIRVPCKVRIARLEVRDRRKEQTEPSAPFMRIALRAGADGLERDTAAVQPVHVICG